MKDNTWLTKKFIAHRGLFNNVDIPENSLLAMEEAVKHNYAIEFDVQPTIDGELVIFHDDTLDRMTGVSGVLMEKTFDEIRKLRLLGTDCVIPTLKELLDTVDGRVELVVELKSHKNIGDMEQKAYDLLKNYKGDFVVESFNPLIVRWFKVNAPEIVRGQLSDDFGKTNLPWYQKYLLKHLKLCKWNGSQFVAYNVETMEQSKAVQRWRKKVPLIVYTVRSQQQYEQTKHLYDNMIFDSYVPIRTDLE